MPRSNTQSFLIRIWIENREIEDPSIVWRGMAQLVSTGDQIYFKSFEELNAFLAGKMLIPYQPCPDREPENKEK